MYEKFYGFRQRPFTLTPNPEFLYMSRVHQDALAHLRLGIESQAGFIAMTGEVGAGKTTVLRLCAGLLTVRRGSAHVLGADLTVDRRGIRSRVGLLGHANGLYDDLSAGENVRFWARTVGATDAEVDAALGRLGLAGRLADTKVAIAIVDGGDGFGRASGRINGG